MGKIEKERRVYFLFSKIHSDNSDKVIYNMVIDYFIHTDNNFSTFMNISHKLLTVNDIKISPETIQHKLLELNYTEIFDNLDQGKDINEPFKIKKSVFETLSSYTNYVDELYTYVDSFLKQNYYKQKHKEHIIDIMLEIIFKRNIQYLRKVITAKEEKKLKNELQVNGNEYNKYSNKDYLYYNQLIEQSDIKFDEILKMIILRMFDFLSLNYNPQHRQLLDQKFGGKIFYLDSSFILRLLGFDNKFREERSIELISLLKNIKDIEFYVHGETISEAQYRIKELINNSLPIIQKKEKIVRKIMDYTDDKKSGVIELYFGLKSEGKINDGKDFLLYFGNITNKLKYILGSVTFKIDNKAIKSDNIRKEKLSELLKHTDKTKSRIKHIIRILSHLDYLRGANNYNPFDIKYWLITTDRKTLQIDNVLCQESEEAIKSACILPTELIRMIDGFGNITNDHVSVFKKFILSSHIFANDYSDEDIQTITRISAMVENVDLGKYNTDELIDNLFEKTSFNDIKNRLNIIQLEEDKNKALIEMFNEANEAYIDNRYTSVVQRMRNSYKKIASLLFKVLIFLFPSLMLLYILKNIINVHLTLQDPKTYFVKEELDMLNGIITFTDIFIFGGAIYSYNKFKKPFENWYINKRIKKIINND